MMLDTAPAIARASRLSYGMPAAIKTPAPKFAYPSPSVRNSYDISAISLLGNCAIKTLTSSTTVHKRDAWRNESTSNTIVFGSKKCAKLIDAKLHAVLSRNMYSLHGFDALMRPDFGQVCHSLIVVSS